MKGAIDLSKQLKTVISLVLTVAALLSLVGATYAWLTMSDAPMVSDLALYLVSDNDMAFLVAPDVDGEPGEFGLILDLSTSSQRGTLLKPVTFSASQFAFLLPEYALDGRIKAGSPIYLETTIDTPSIYSPYISPAADSEILGEYVYKTTFWVRADAVPVDVSLASTFTNTDGVEVTGSYLVGEPIWNDTSYYHENSGSGAEYAIRIGLYFFGTEEDPDDHRFVIIEPNADGGNAVLYDSKYFTQSVDGEGMDLAAGDKRVTLIQQYSSGWKEKDPILKGEVDYTSGKVIGDDYIITIQQAETRKVELYVWLEGNDADCLNTISSGRIIGNLVFGADISNLPLNPE